MSVQPIPIDTSGFALRRVRSQSLLWLQIAAAERLLALAGLVLLSPLFICAAAAIAVLSRRPPLIAHRRMGQEGRPIWVLKFRTMWNSRPAAFRFHTLVERLPEDTAPNRIKSREDPRVTSRLASFCRSYSIDELPQLWHVLKGDLALIGPRPLTASELEVYYGDSIWELLSMKPGLSGLWQIKGRSRLNYRERRRLDLFLVRHWSVPLYLRILLATIPAVISGKNAW